MEKDSKIRTIISFSFPELLLILVTYLLLGKQADWSQVRDFIMYYPFLVGIIGVFLGIRFHRVRLVYGIIVLASLI